MFLIHISWSQLRLFQTQSAVSFIYSFKLQDYFWLFVLARRISRYWSAWTIYQVKGLIYQSQTFFVLPLCLAFPYGIVSYEYTVGLKKVIWNARFITFLCLFKITYYGAKWYFMWDDNYTVDPFLEHEISLQTCSFASIPGSTLINRSFFSFSVNLKTWIIFDFLFSPFYKHLLNCQILWLPHPGYFLSLPFLNFIYWTLVVCYLLRSKVICLELFWWDPDIKGKTIK